MKSHVHITIFMLAGLPYFAMAQQEYGTVLVFEVTPSQAVIAADSKTLRGFKGKAVERYNVCKILTFENKYVFAASGNSGYWDESKQGKNVWNMRDLTTNLYKTGGVTDVSDFAYKWAQAVLETFSKYPPDPPQNGRNYVTGVFIGISHGVIVGQEATIVLDKGKMADRYFPIYANQLLFATAGRAIDEYDVNRTPRAHQWHQELDRLILKDRIIRLAELEKRLDTSGEIGGPIDAVSITPFGVQCIQSKPGCGCDSKTPQK